MQQKTKVLALGALLLGLASTSAMADLCAPGKKADVLWKGEWYPAKVVKVEPGRCFITYTGYDASYDEWVGPERLKIKVSWKGEWYPAKVLAKEGDKYKIHYDGYASSDDEVVPVSRIEIR